MPGLLELKDGILPENWQKECQPEVKPDLTLEPLGNEAPQQGSSDDIDWVITCEPRYSLLHIETDRLILDGNKVIFKCTLLDQGEYLASNEELDIHVVGRVDDKHLEAILSDAKHFKEHYASLDPKKAMAEALRLKAAFEKVEIL